MFRSFYLIISLNIKLLRNEANNKVLVEIIVIYVTITVCVEHIECMYCTHDTVCTLGYYVSQLLIYH
jgi:hypothetical protein